MSVSWPDVERTLCRIPHVTRAHVVPDAVGNVRELHIVATAGKPAKQLVRDVQSVAMASFGVDLDRHVVSVVQLDDPPGDEGRAEAVPGDLREVPEVRLTPEARERTLLCGMTLQSQQGRCSISVALRWGAREASGSADGASTARGLHRLAAEATLDALGRLHPQVGVGGVEEVEIRQMGAGRVALVSIAHRFANVDDVLVGTANVRAAGEFDAVARAVLDAVNRRLPA